MTATSETNEASTAHFVEYLEAHLARKDWSIKQLASAAGLSASVIFRWRHGYVPNVPHARAIARALGVPVLEILIESGQLTSEEAGAYSTGRPLQLADIDTQMLSRELTRRIEHATKRVEGLTYNQVERDAKSSELPPDDLALALSVAAHAPRSDDTEQDHDTSSTALVER